MWIYIRLVNVFTHLHMLHMSNEWILNVHSNLGVLRTLPSRRWTRDLQVLSVVTYQSTADDTYRGAGILAPQSFDFDPESCALKTDWSKKNLRQFFLLWPLGEIGMVSGWTKSEEGIVVVWFWRSRSHQRFGKIKLSGFKSLNLDGSGSTLPPMDVSSTVVIFQISRHFSLNPWVREFSPVPWKLHISPLLKAPFESMIFYRPVGRWEPSRGSLPHRSHPRICCVWRTAM